MAKDKHFRINTSGSVGKGRVRSSRSAGTPSQLGRRPEQGEVSPTLDAERLKRAYVFEYRMSESAQTGTPSEYRPSPTFEANGTWRKAAEALRKEGIDPVQYVRVLFRELRHLVFFFELPPARGWRSSDKPGSKDVWYPPTPGELTSPRYLDLYERAVERAGRDLEIALNTQYSIGTREIWSLRSFAGKSVEDATAITLLNSSLDLTPLFRYCLAMSILRVPAGSPEEEARNARFRKIADRYFEPACIQYLGNPEGYREKWKRVLSPTLIREAERFYDQYLNALEL